MFIAITYIGNKPGIMIKFENRKYDFEWQKSLGIGKRRDEVDPRDAERLMKWKDGRGKRMFFLEQGGLDGC